jgi:hypothetical protein
MAQQDSDQPTIYATVRADLTGVLDVDGVKHDVTGTDDADVRSQMLTQVTGRARMVGRPVLLVTDDVLGQGSLNVHPDGRLEAVGDFTTRRSTPGRLRSLRNPSQRLKQLRPQLRLLHPPARRRL